MEVVISDGVRSAFPDLHLAHLSIGDVRVGVNSNDVTSELKNISEKIRSSVTLDELKDRPDFRAYRDFFWRLGVDPTKIRPASEALVRRILRGASLPRINDFVDAYNSASIITGIPIAAFDIDALEETVTLRFSNSGEEFLGIGMSEPKILGDEQLVMSSGDELIAIYPYRDADASKITLETKNALLITCGVPGIGIDALIEAANNTRDRVIAVCGGHPSKIIYE